VSALSSNTSLWYLTRGTGIVTLALLTAVVALGVASNARLAAPGSPRFVTAALHRNLSLLVVALLAVHVLTAVLDPFAPIRLVDAFVPMASAYRPLWLGLGALGADLLIALVVTSLVRVRLGYRPWRAVHWLAYACWPVALLHMLGTGSDVRSTWLLGFAAACTAAVLLSVWWRLAAARGPVGLRLAAAVLTVATPLVVVSWLGSGPLAPGWAHRAGTPVRLLHTGAPRAPSGGSGTP
jgi:sulfoxide reductase heme-binding subunit YedZ